MTKLNITKIEEIVKHATRGGSITMKIVVTITTLYTISTTIKLQQHVMILIGVTSALWILKEITN